MAAPDSTGPPSPPGMPPTTGFPSNPGTVEDLHKKCQNIFPMFFEGAKLLVNKALNQNFQVSHTMTMSNMMPSGYRFGATYVGQKMLSPQEAYPLLLADIDPSGNLNANIVHAPTENTRLKAIAQINQSKWVSTQMTLDYKGPLHTASLTLGNPDFIHGTGVGVLHYLKAITPWLSLGAELAYQASPQLPGGHVAVVSAAARIAKENDYTFAATLGNGGQAHATFYQKCTDNLSVGVEMETNFKVQESTASIGYEFDMPKGNFVMRGSVDTDFVVKSVLEKKLAPLPFTLALCSMMNHKKDSFQIGCGLIIG